MKNILTTALFVVLSFYGYSQVEMLRYNDNFNYLVQDTVSRHGIEKLKLIQVADDVNFSFGGELREQLQYYRNFNFGDLPSGTGSANTWQLWHRAMLHTNIAIGKKTRVFAQLGSTYRFLNPNPPAPEIDENHLSIHQLFAEYRFNSKWLTRVGRQEMSYGNHRLITFREGPNTRLAFDAAVVKYHTDKKKFDLFIMSPVISQNGAFDDKTFKDILAGSYGTERVFGRKLSIDYYFMLFESARRKYNYVGGNERRKIAGIRLFSENPRLNYELECTYQFGRFSDLRINALGLFADVNYAVLPKRVLVLGLAGNYASGDKSGFDRQLNTYNALFSKPQYGLTAPIGASNLLVIQPYLKFAPVKGVNVYLGSHFMWRSGSYDGIYTPTGAEMRPRPEKLFVVKDNGIGTLLFLESNYQVCKTLSIALDASQFFANDFIKNTGKGRDITYLSFKVGYKF